MNTQRRTAAPRYNLSRVFTTRDRLANDILTEFICTELSGAWFEHFVDSLCAGLGRVERRIVWDSVRDVAGQSLDAVGIKDLAWRLAGNIDRLRAGIIVPPWNAQAAKEWAPVQITSWRFEKSKRGVAGGAYTMRVLAGTACPLRLSNYWTHAACRYIARYVGYTSRRAGSPFAHPAELVNMRIWVQLDPERCHPGQPGFWEVACTQGLKKWNKQIIDARFRRGWKCPYNFDHYCYQCPVGYLECRAAVHRETYGNTSSVGVEVPGDGQEVPGTVPAPGSNQEAAQPTQDHADN